MAGTIPAGSMSTEVKLNGSQSVKTLKELKQAVQEASSAWKAQRAELKSVGQSTAAAESKYKGLAESVKKQKDYISGLRIAQKHLQEAQKSVDRSTQEGQREYGKYNEALQKNETRIHSAEQKLASLTNQQTKAKSSLNYYKSGLADVQKQLKTNESVAKSYVVRLEAEGKGYESAKAKLNSYKDSLANLRKQQSIQTSELSRIARETGKSSDAYKRQEVRVNQTATSIAKLNSKIKSSQTEVNKLNPHGFNKLANGAQHVTNAADKMKSGLKHAWDNVKTGATAAAAGIGAVGAAAISGAKKAGNLQQVYKEITNLAVTGGEKQREAIKNVTAMQRQGRDMSIKYGKSQQDIAEAFEDLVKRGYTTKQALGAMRTELQGSVASGDDFKDVVSVSSTVLESFGMRAKTVAQMTSNTKRAVNELAYAADMTSTGFKDLGYGMSYVGSSAHQAGFNLSETASAMGILSNNGLEASKAGTGLNQVINRLSDATGKLVKGDKKNALAKLGIKPKEITDSTGKLKNLATVFGVLNKHMKGMTKVQKINIMKSLFGMTGEQAGLILAKYNKQLGSLSKNVLKAGKNGKYVADLSAKNSQTAKMQMARLKQAGNAFAMTLGSKMLPAINEAGDSLVVFLTKSKDGKRLTNDFAKAVEGLATGLANTIKWIAHHRTETKLIAEGLGAAYGVVKLASFVQWLNKTRLAFKGLSIGSKLLSGWDKSLIHLSNAKTRIGKVASVIGKLNGKFLSVGKKLGTALGNGLKSIGDKALSAGKFLGSKITQGIKATMKFSMGKRLATGALAGAAVATPEVVNAIKDRHSANKRSQDIGGAVGALAGGTLTSMIPVVGPLLAPIGAIIGKYAGQWGGKAVNNFTKGWQRNKPPKKFWSLENLGWSTKHAMKQAGHWGAGVIRSMAEGINKGQNNLKKAFARSSKNMHSAAKGLGKWSSQVRRNTQKAFNKAGSVAKKGWNAIYKHSNKGTRQVLKSIAGFGKRYVASHKRYTKATEKNFGSFGRRLKKNHGNLFKTIGQTAKRQLKIEQSRWHSNWNNIAKTSKGIWHGMQTNNHNMYLNFNRWTHGGLGKVLSGFRSFGRTLSSFWTRLMNSIGRFFRKTFAGIGHTINNVQSAIGKLMGGKVKVGNLHLANGTDWRKRYPVPAIVNDGSDSPSTNNREGLIDTDGSVYPYPNVRNLRTILWPGQNVINAHDMAAIFGNAFHFAAGTVSRARNLPELNKRGGSGTIQGMSKLLKQLIKGLKTVRKLAKVTLKIKGEKNVSKLSHDIKSAAKGSSALAKATRRVGREIRSSYSSVKRHNFASLITKEVKKATTASSKDMNKFVKDFDKDQRKMVSNSNKNTKKLVKDFDTQWKKVLKNATSDYKKWVSSTEHLQSQFNNRFKKGWHSLDNATSSIFKKFWSSMHTTARKGMNAVLAVLNGGISRIDSVVREFGGSGHAIHRVSHLATGTGYFSGQRRAITKPTLAILNDGNDSPETGNRETLWNPTSGDLYAVHGRNVPMIIPPKWEVFNGRESRELGFSHFASGTGALHHLYELAKHYWGKPIQTGKSMFNAVRGLTGAINKIAQGMRKSGMGQGIDWWSQLWKMVEDKVNDDGGPASGLLKAVEKYGEGHRYVRGAAGPTTFDCSGLVMYALKHAYGISYPHFSGAQYGMTQHISKSQAKMGDLVFWGSGGSDHVGVYAGGNRYFSAQSPSQGIHMNTLDSVVGKGRPLFGRVRGVNTHGNKGLKIKAKNSLQKLIRAQVGKGFWRTIQKIADKYGTDGQFGNPAGDGVMRWKGLVKKALRANGFSASPYQVSAWLRVIARESNGNPHAVNNWDINAREGHPSKGLVQTIPGVFAAFHHKGHNNIFNGYDDLLAGINYMAHKYGRGPRAFALVSNPKIGYANGGIANTPSIFGESGPEMAIPLIPTKSTRAWELIGKAIGILSKGNGNQVSLQQVQKEQKQEQERWAMLFNFLTDLVGEMADTTIKTDVKIDGRTAWSALSKYARQEFKRMAVSQRKGYAHGI